LPWLIPLVPSLSSQRKGVYNPRAVIPHAALLRQAFAHCAKFLTAASRRSLGRISVPVWLIILSDQLPIIALVGRYPTNKLIGRRPLQKRIAAFLKVRPLRVCGISSPFEELFPTSGQVTHALLTRLPLTRRFVRLACVKHAASVRPEPGSNSQNKNVFTVSFHPTPEGMGYRSSPALFLPLSSC
jgi:hypothetical protein